MIPEIPRVLETPGGINILYQGKHLYHEQFPEKHAVQKALSAPLLEKSLVLVPCPALGHGLKDLLSRLPSGSHVLCVEKEEPLMALTYRYAVPRFANEQRVSFVRTDSLALLREYLETKVDLKRFRRVVLLPLNRGYMLHRPFYDQAHRMILNQLQTSHRNRLTTLRMGKRWMTNLFQNLPCLPSARPVTSLKIHKPPLVIGAGESVEKKVSWIKDLRERVTLIAVDTILPALGSWGIRPDYTVSMDAQSINLQDLIGFPYRDTALIADLTVHPGILRKWEGPKYLFLSAFTTMRWFETPEVNKLLPPLLPPLGSVGNTALYLALTYSEPTFPVFSLGMDFYYPAGKPHARGTYSHRFHLYRQTRLTPSPLLERTLCRPHIDTALMDGRRVKADAVLHSFKEVARTLRGPDRVVYALGTEGLDFGALPIEDQVQLGRILQGTRPVPLQGRGRRTGVGSSTCGPQANASLVREYLQSLSQSLEEMEQGLQRLHSSFSVPEGPEMGLDPSFSQAVDQLDFLLLDIPLPEGSAVTQPAFIIRLMANIQHYRRVLSQAIQRMEPAG